jgi:hypothetical protein
MKVTKTIFENTNVLLYNGQYLEYSKYHNDTVYYQTRRNKELSFKTNESCAWCSCKYNSANKLYYISKKMHHLKHRDYDTCKSVICRDCMYIINVLKTFDTIRIYDKTSHTNYFIYPYKKWIVHTWSSGGRYLLTYDVGFINHYKIPTNHSLFGMSYEIKTRLDQLINQNDQHYNILLKVYFLLKQVLLKDVSMVIGCFIISSCINKMIK